MAKINITRICAQELSAATHPTWLATQHRDGLVEIQWACGPVGIQADGRIGFVVDVPYRIKGEGRKAVVCSAHREARTFDASGTMFVTVIG